MASKGPRSKLDHETRARRQKALEAPREPPRPKTHWDHVLEEMIWLSKDFEAERKWKLAQAKKVALRASRGVMDLSTRGEKRMKEEEQRMKKVALNISKDVKKFWTKVEKLVLYKHQLELDDKKKKALDKQLEYLLGQTERYSTMLAENLMGASNSRPSEQTSQQEKTSVIQVIESDEKTLNGLEALACPKVNSEIENDGMEGDNSSVMPSSNLLNKSSFPVRGLSAEVQLFHSLQKQCDDIEVDDSLKLLAEGKSGTDSETGAIEADGDYDILLEDESEDDERTIDEDEALITEAERREELSALQNEVDLPLEEILKRYSMSEVNGESCPDGYGIAIDGPDEIVPGTSKSDVDSDLHLVSKGYSNGILKSDYHLSEVEPCLHNKESVCLTSSDIMSMDYDSDDDQGDDEFAISALEEKDDETTLEEEEEFEKRESRDPEDEIAMLQKESEVPLEDLLARYKDFNCSGSAEDDSVDISAHSDIEGSPATKMIDLGEQDTVMSESNVSNEGKTILPFSGEAVVSGPKLQSEEDSQRDARIADAAAAARSAQPTGNTFSTTNVKTKYPFLMKHSLREYQHIGLGWLVTMYEKRLNGILADEMGLGKTIMTIALLAHLACEKGIWGPHLIVVPTSVMLNWETEFLKWCPAFKILTYFGSAKERKFKRQGWMKPNSFHVCITTYRLVIQDSKAFKRKKWKYLILDEAHLIKNWKSQRWQTLLNFNSKRRILLTGTPLQNDLMELWSLMHFLMPHIFQSHQEFKDWFCNPISGMVEGQEKVNKEVVDRLHNVLRPFILRRLKRDVEKQLPMKHEHVIHCRLSKRQRNLYEDFIANSETQATLASANFIGMLNVIMQLRKVCNHPDLFEGRPIVSSFDMERLEMQLSSNVCSMLSSHPFSSTNLTGLGFVFTHLDFSMTSWESGEIQTLATPSRLIECRGSTTNLDFIRPGFRNGNKCLGTNIFSNIQKAICEERLKEAKQRAAAISWWNSLKCRKKPVYSRTLRSLLTVKHPVYDIQRHKENPVSYEFSPKLADLVLSPVERFQKMIDQVEAFMFAIPAARAPSPDSWCCRSGTSVFIDPVYKKQCSEILLPLLTPIRPAIVRRQLYFPDRRLIQFDCGKLQQLAILLRRLKSEGHRALIFTQMTKMLDILEAFINLYGYTYMRLDGSTQPEERQTLMQRFNTNPKIFLFILSTRSGGVGINLVGADTVIFYDSDWNPAMDQQAQDRCHRIGQTREVNIYRLVSESTIEENILKKAKQKRALDDLVIQSGGYNTEFFKKLDPLELFSGHGVAAVKNMGIEKKQDEAEVPVSNDDIEAALRNAEDEADYMALKKVEEEEAVDNQEFTEEAIGKMEDEDLGIEDVMKADESVDQDVLAAALDRDNLTAAGGNDLVEEKSLTLACNEDDADMIADVKQMAAAAVAAGQAVLSFENQLRPIDRYAMKFLEVWDPIIDKNAVDYQVQVEEREWELGRIEKFKEDMEADVDDDDEPLVYEKWDAEYATKAYHQQVEALAQHQLMEELESKAKEIENEDLNSNPVRSQVTVGGKKAKKKKSKKAKFKSLKKESLSSAHTALQGEDMVQYMSSDNEDNFRETDANSEVGASCIMLRKKRKKDETAMGVEKERTTNIKFKKSKKTSLVTILPPTEPNKLISHGQLKDSRIAVDGGADLELRMARGKMGGKISISTMPMKRVYTIKPEKLKKKGNMWPGECFPPPDSWLPQEDAVLCALVHEYGPNWSLVSDTLYGMTTGGVYRGRFRQPAHCCERIRELVQKYVHTVADSLNSEKASIMSPAKGQLRVTEDSFRVLLDAAMEQPDGELLLQRHFTALLTTVWRMTYSPDQSKSPSVSTTKLYPSIMLFGKSVNPNGQSKKKFDMSHVHLITKALHDVDVVSGDTVMKQMEEDPPSIEMLDLVVEFGRESAETGGCNLDFPSVVSLTIPDLDPHPPVKIPTMEDQLRSSKQLPESRFRASSSACLDGGLGWAASAFPTVEPRSRSSLKSPSIGKHKLGESSRQSKFKVRKVSEEPSDSLLLLAETLFQSSSASLHNPSPYSDSSTPAMVEGSFEDFLNDMPGAVDGETALSISDFDTVPHCYNPSFIAGLDDCFSLELSDIEQQKQRC